LYVAAIMNGSTADVLTDTTPGLTTISYPDGNGRTHLKYKVLASASAVNYQGTLSGGTAGLRVLALLADVGTPPVNTVAPVASGAAVVGNVVSVTDGTWTGTPAPTFTYQWQRDNSGGGVYGDIGGETANTYLLSVADLSCHVRCVVTGTNTAGSDDANSNALGPVTSAPVGSPRRLSRLVLDHEGMTIVVRGT
jgi:hypothetical protein